MEDAVSGIGSVLDAISDTLKRIATALETIAAEAVDQQSERRYRVRRRYATITRWIAEASPETNKIALQWERERLLAENPWLRDEVQS